MSDFSLNDPNLQTFEARLAAMSPQISPAEQQTLLYQCAFAAGRRAGAGAVRRWQAAAAVLVLLSLGMSVPLLRDRQPPAQPAWQPSIALAAKPTQSPAERNSLGVRQPAAIALDAWQVPQAATSPSEAAPRDPSVASLTVATLIRAMQSP